MVMIGSKHIDFNNRSHDLPNPNFNPTSLLLISLMFYYPVRLYVFVRVMLIREFYDFLLTQFL